MAWITCGRDVQRNPSAERGRKCKIDRKLDLSFHLVERMASVAVTGETENEERRHRPFAIKRGRAGGISQVLGRYPAVMALLRNEGGGGETEAFYLSDHSVAEHIDMALTVVRALVVVGGQAHPSGAFSSCRQRSHSCRVGIGGVVLLRGFCEVESWCGGAGVTGVRGVRRFLTLEGV